MAASCRAPLPAVALPAASTPPALDLAPFRARAHGPLWIEVSPNPWGIPAAAGLSAAEAWRLPDDVWRHLAPGSYLLQVVDDAGRELGRRSFRRGGEAPADDGGGRGRAAASPPLETLRHRLAERWPSRVEAAGIVEAAAAAGPGASAVLVAGDADLPDEGVLARALGTLHASLHPGGRLLWSGPPDQSRVLRGALPEAGFVVERRSRDGAAEVLAARADRFVVRPYREGDEARILPLLRESFGVGRGPKRWAWRYRDNPHGADRISAAFDGDGRLVGDQTVRTYLIEQTRRKGEAMGHDYSGLTPAQLIDDWHYFVFPGLVFNTHAGGFYLFRIRPDFADPDVCLFDLFIFRWPDETKPPPERPPHTEADAATTSFGKVLDQDFANLPGVQRGLHHDQLDEVTLLTSEVRIVHLHRVLDRYLSGDVDVTELAERAGDPASAPR